MRFSNSNYLLSAVEKVARGPFVPCLTAFCCVFYVGASIPVANAMMRSLDLAAAVCFFCMLPLWVAMHGWKRRSFFPWLAAFFAAVVLSVALACFRDTSLHLSAWLKTIRFSFLLLFSHAACLWSARQRTMFINTLLLAGIAEAAFVNLMYLFQVERFCASQTFFVNGQMLQRASGFVSDAASFAALCAALIFVSLEVMLETTDIKLRVAAAACFALNVLGMLFSRTRTAIGTVIVVFCVYIFMRVWKQNHFARMAKLAGRVMVGFGAIVAIAVVIGNLFFASAVCAGMDGWMELIRGGGNIWSKLNELFSERIFIWAQYVKILAQVPLWELLFGSGYYLFEESMNVFSFAGTGIAMNRPVHNMLLNVLIGMGLLGWTGLIGWMSAMLRDLLGSASKYARLARVLLLCQIFFMLVDDSLTMVNSAVILFVVAAFAVCEEGVSLKTMDCQC